MRHTAILMSALAAGLRFIPEIRPDGIEHKLYIYARERKFPPPETLARKAAELAGGAYPYPSIADAPEGERVFFTAFRAVAEALEPFHEDDPADEPSASVDEQGLPAEAVVAADADQASAGSDSSGLSAVENDGSAGQQEDGAEPADPTAPADPPAQAEDPAGLDGAAAAHQDGEAATADAAADQVDAKNKKKTK